MNNRTDNPRLKSPATKASTARSSHRVSHVYDRAQGTVARELGVQCRMLCGVWGWPARIDSGVRAATDDGAPNRCKRCAIVLAVRERRRAQQAEAAARHRAEFLAARPLVEFAIDDAKLAGITVHIDGPRDLDGERVRCEVGLEDFVRPYVRLCSDQSEREALNVLALARLRLSLFDRFEWFFEDDDLEHEWPFVLLCGRGAR